MTFDDEVLTFERGRQALFKNQAGTEADPHHAGDEEHRHQPHRPAPGEKSERDEQPLPTIATGSAVSCCTSRMPARNASAARRMTTSL